MSKKKPVARLDKVDRKLSQRVNHKRTEPWMRVIGAASELADQPQMRFICAATIAVGLYRNDRKLTLTGVRMLAAHTLATWGKGRIKAVIDRTRPDRAHRGYTFDFGDSREHDQNSFPSGHSAGAVAVAQAVARNYPEHAFAAQVAAGVTAAVQVPRGKHFVGDVLVGSFIGLVAEKILPSASLATALSLGASGTSQNETIKAARPAEHRRDRRHERERAGDHEDGGKGRRARDGRRAQPGRA